MPHSSGLSFQEQIAQKISKSKRSGDAEGLAYYREILDNNYCACASYESYKGSWAYTEWIEKPGTQDRILKAKREIESFSRTNRIKK